MLCWRLISSAIIISALILLIWLDVAFNFGRPGIWLAPLAMTIAFLAAGEALRLLRAAGLQPISWTVYAGSVLVVLFACAPILWGTSYPMDCPVGKLGWSLLGLAAAIGMVMLGEIMRFQVPGGIIQNVAGSVFAISYIGVLMGFLVQLRLLHENRWGIAALLSLVIVVKLSDSGAYTVGRLIGRHKMAPRLSPGKTMEGAIGAVVSACLAAWITFVLIVPGITGEPSQEPVWAIGVFGVVIAAAGMLGDLAISLLKRDAGLKDSSQWVRGLGGVLDIMDSILAAGPAAFACWVSGLVGPLGT